MLDGREPRLSRAEEICHALGLEFYLGPPRGEAVADPLDAVPEAGGGFKWAENAGVFVTPWPVPTRGTPSEDAKLGYSPHGCAWFGSGFLAEFDLDPTKCEVIEVRDNSMEPGLVAGGVALIDRRRAERRDGRIYAVEHHNEIFIRRADKADHGWLLTATSPDWPTVPWADFVMIGQVVWTARMVELER